MANQGKLIGIRWRGTVYLVPQDIEGFKANALLTAGEATRVYQCDLRPGCKYPAGHDPKREPCR